MVHIHISSENMNAMLRAPRTRLAVEKLISCCPPVVVLLERLDHVCLELCAPSVPTECPG